MRSWVLADEGDRWTVKLDVRDLVGHLDTTCRGWSSTLAARVRLVISRLVLIFALVLDVHGSVRVVRSMFIPGALHGIEASLSLLASASLRKLRSSIHKVVWSRRQPLACVGAVLSLMDRPTGWDPACCVVWFRFRMFRRYLALWPEVGRVYHLVELVNEGCPGHGPMHLLVTSAAEVGFRWDLLALGWSRPGLPLLSGSVGLFIFGGQRFLMPSEVRLRLIFAMGMVFVVVLFWTFMVPWSCLTLPMFGKEIRLCSGVSWLVVFGMVIFWAE